LLGNDISLLKSGDPILDLISNKDLIKINQDTLGKPALCVYNCDTLFIAGQVWSNTGYAQSNYRIFVGELNNSHVIAITN